MEAKRLVGWNLRRLRVAKDFTIEELAGRADADASFVARLERGQVNVSIVMLDRLARQLGAKLADLTVEPEPGTRPPSPLRAGRKPSTRTSSRRGGGVP
jgi:transcriptional regulator with XRE-family HTH domain